MNGTERIKMVKAMEYIARQLNDEDTLFTWLTGGVADGDIEYGDLDGCGLVREEYYTNDEDFSGLMNHFLWCMKLAYNDGGLYCDGVTSETQGRTIRSAQNFFGHWLAKPRHSSK